MLIVRKLKKNYYLKNNLFQQVQTATAALVRASNEVPLLGDGYELLSTFPQYAQFMATQRGRIMAL